MNAPDLYNQLPREATDYLRRLRAGLAPLPEADREEIARETAAHLLDRAEGSPGGVSDVAGIAAALAELGDPEAYASRFVGNYRISKALASGSPLALAATVLRLTGRGFRAFLGGTAVFTLYLLAVGMLAIGALKPVLPRQTGLFVGPGGRPIALGLIDPVTTAAAREVLGYWLVPIAIVAGVLLLLAANRVAGAFLRSLRRAG